jgi:hypothetical protein
MGVYTDNPGGANLARTVSTVFPDGGVVELRVLGDATYSGYFDDHAKLIEEAEGAGSTPATPPRTGAERVPRVFRACGTGFSAYLSRIRESVPLFRAVPLPSVRVGGNHA